MLWFCSLFNHIFYISAAEPVDIAESVQTELLVQDALTKDQIALELPTDPNVIFDTSAGEISRIQVLVMKGENNDGVQNAGSGDGLDAKTWADAKRKDFTISYAIESNRPSPDSWRSQNNRKKRFVNIFFSKTV